tara:strand:- start:264 stop:440 length:177 start_codon:yes stop_codon:yes gene_type:complete
MLTKVIPRKKKLKEIKKAFINAVFLLDFSTKSIKKRAAIKDMNKKIGIIYRKTFLSST